jgi:hypothetical protein
MINVKTGKTCFILYELTYWKLPILIFASVIYDETWFIRCNARLAQLFGRYLLRLGISQITEHDFFENGTFEVGHDNVLLIGKRLANRFSKLISAFSNLGGIKGYGDMVEQSFCEAWANEGYINPFIEKFLKQKEQDYRSVCFWGKETTYPELWVSSFPKNVRPIKGVPIISWIASVIDSLLFIIIMAAMPYISISRALLKGVRLSHKENIRKLKRQVFILHRYTDFQGRDTFRDMYFINGNIIDVCDSIHSPMATSKKFSSEKQRFLEERGGEVLYTSNLRISVAHVFRLITLDHFPILIATFQMVFSGQRGNRKFARNLLEYYHLLMISRLMLQQVSADIVFIEGESASISRAIGVEARRQGVRSVTMIHGSGGQTLRQYGRANSYIDYYIVNGNYYSNLSRISPEVNYFYAAGNIEVVTGGKTATPILPKYINEDREKFIVVAFFINIQTNITSMKSIWSKSAYIDENKIASYTSSLLGPLFNWISENKNIHLIWRTKPNHPDCKIDNPFIKNLISSIPSDRITVANKHTLGQISRTSDICVASTMSSAMTTAILSGTPTVGLDIISDRADLRYDPLLSATTGEELLYNVRQLLAHGLSKSVYEKFEIDWRGTAPEHALPQERIKALFDLLLSSEDHLPDPSEIKF